MSKSYEEIAGEITAEYAKDLNEPDGEVAGKAAAAFFTRVFEVVSTAYKGKGSSGAHVIRGEEED